LDAQPRAYGNEAERRYHLRRLDDLLEALERLNLAEAKELPVAVKDRIEKEGIMVEPGISFSLGAAREVPDRPEGRSPKGLSSGR